MARTTTLIIGAGQAGLAMSRCLTERSVDHVLLERSTIASSWRSERWDSLRLLTPSWQSRLPGWRYAGPDRDGYMTMPEVVSYLSDYARWSSAPVQEHTTVLSVRAAGAGSTGYRVETDQGLWQAQTVVSATGACAMPSRPARAEALPTEVHQLVPTRYRNPGGLPDGGVLVVGASASGVQIAEELARAGRDVTLAVGSHVRVPRTYRGMDVQWWLDATGALDRRTDDVADLAAARRAPSLQLVGSPERRTIDLATLADAGVRTTGRLIGVDGPRATFADDLPTTCDTADRRLARLLDRCDHHARTAGLEDEIDDPDRPAPIAPHTGPRRIDLRAEGIATVVWATGYRPHHPWLPAPVLDGTGQVRHDGGVVADAPGLYVLGLPFLRRRKSTFIDGVGDDARDLTDHLVGHLDQVSVTT